VQSYFSLSGGTGALAPFDANGLPVFSNSSASSGYLLASAGKAGITGQLDYTITSLAPVPLPATAWLLLSALGGLGLLVRRSQRQSLAALAI